MRLPVDTLIEAAARPGVAAEKDASPTRIHVLLLEDNPGDTALIDLMLSEAGGGLFVLEQVDRVSAALSRLSQGGIDLVLCDLSLPDSQGLETFTRLHARSPQVPIIVLSGLSDSTVAIQAVHEGAQDFLVKGQVDGQLLVRAMRYAIERKRLTQQLGRYADELRTKNAQLEADFNMAREIQEIFLPEKYPTFPAWSGPEQSALQFCHRYLPAAAVGGDFFDAFAISDTIAGVFICDVMGHGMRAALVTAIMRGLVEELLPIADDPGKFLGGINRTLNTILHRTRDPFIATAFYGLVDVGAGELRYCCAGHPSPILVRRGEGVAENLKSRDPRHAPALGLFQKPEFPTCSRELRPEDLLLAFTDGVFEAANPDGEEFGIERLLQAVRRRTHMPAETLVDEVLGEIKTFSGTSDFEDDVCILGVEVDRLLKADTEKRFPA